MSQFVKFRKTNMDSYDVDGATRSSDKVYFMPSEHMIAMGTKLFYKDGFKGATFQASTGKLTFHKYSGEDLVIDLPTEYIIDGDNSYYDADTHNLYLKIQHSDNYIEIPLHDVADAIKDSVDDMEARLLDGSLNPLESTRAVKDDEGHNIANTYATKVSLNTHTNANWDSSEDPHNLSQLKAILDSVDDNLQNQINDRHTKSEVEQMLSDYANKHGLESDELTSTPLSEGGTFADGDFGQVFEAILSVRSGTELGFYKIEPHKFVNGESVTFDIGATTETATFTKTDSSTWTFTSSDTAAEMGITGLRVKTIQAIDVEYSDSQSVKQAIDSKANKTEFEKRITEIEETARRLSQTSEKITEEGEQVIHLPANVATAQMKAQIDGLTLQSEQLYSNTNFENGTTDWQEEYSSISASDGILTVTGTGGNKWARFYQSVEDYKENEKYYVYMNARVTNPDCVEFTGLAKADGMSTVVKQLLSNPEENKWYHASGVLTLGSGGSGNTELLLAHQYEDSSTADGKEMEVDYAYSFNISKLIDNKQYSPLHNDTFDNLTDDQIQEQMDFWVQDGTLPNDNIQAVNGNRRVRVVGKNLFDKNNPRHILNNYFVREDRDGQVTYIGDDNVISAIVPAKEGNIYTYTTLGNRNKSAFYDEYPRGGLYPISEVFSGGETGEAPSGTKYLMVYIGNEEGYELGNLQLEQGDTATPYEPYTEIDLYIEAPLGRRLPNGVKDTIEERDGAYYHIQKTKKYDLIEDDVDNIVTNNDDYDIVLVDKKDDHILQGDNTRSLENSRTTFIVGFTPTKQPGEIGEHYNFDESRIGLIVEKNKYADLSEAQADLAGTGTVYQIDELIETKADTKGQLLGKPFATAYFTPHISDVKQYDGTITTAYNIDTLEKLVRLEDDGTETELDVSDAVITDNTFTHPELATDDMVWFVYKYTDHDDVFGDAYITWFDSDKIKVSPNGTAWRLVPEVDDTGAITWTTEEVV